MMKAKKNANDEADVCLVLEGTYPYVRGGVSTWVHQIITSLPDLTFSVFYIGWEKEEGASFHYTLPANLLEVREAYLCEKGASGKAYGPISSFRLNSALNHLDQLLVRDNTSLDEITAVMESLARAATGHTFESAWTNRRAWNSIEDFYDSQFEDHSFVDYFWALKNMALPCWAALKCVAEVPRARVLHSVCTGYAGLVGALAARLQKRPFLLSEHGIYVRERVKDLLKREWTPKGSDPYLSPAHPGVSPHTRLWMDFFLLTGKIAYHGATQVVSLFQKNREIQASLGAEKEKVRIIPNGIDLEKFREAAGRRRKRRQKKSRGGKVVVGFLGRIVAIKDVRLLIRAAAQVCRACPEAEFQIVGPQDEDADYAAGCISLIQELGLESRVKMPGPVSDPFDILPEFDIMVLSSVSEGLPFSIIEAFAMEMPVVSTRVGACHELIFGRPGESPAIGAAGETVPPGDASALAQGLIRLVQSRELQDKQGAAGRRRVEAHYLEKDVVAAYGTLYTQIGAMPSASGPAPALETALSS